MKKPFKLMKEQLGLACLLDGSDLTDSFITVVDDEDQFIIITLIKL